MNDMAVMVEEQGETINAIEQNADVVEKDVETGWVRMLYYLDDIKLLCRYKHTEAAKKSAISARQKRYVQRT